MKKSRYTEEQIIGILKQHEAGVKTTDPVSRAWDQRNDLLQLEGDIRRYGREPSAAAAADGE